MSELTKSKDFGRILKQIRESKRLSQREVCKTMHMTASYFCKLEQGVFTSLPTRETIDRLSKAMNCNATEHNILLVWAGRLDPELEQLALVAQGRPEIKTLLKLCAALTTGQINQLISTIEHYE